MPPDTYRADASRLSSVRWLSFFLSLAVPSVFNNFNGILDTTGTAVGSVNVPSAPVLAGIFFSVAFVTANPSAPKGIQDISGPWKITITK